ncbi:MAG: hypothetical protein FWG72_00115 [Oscillospiraceae bacterium]|nr:hypothetical protein [Oscillospiraceae bacterium]
MNRRDRLREALDDIRMPETAHHRILIVMQTQPRRRVSFDGFGRAVAVTVALAICAVGMTVMWNYIFSDGRDTPPPPLTTPADTTASPSPEATPPDDAPARLDLGFLIDIDWPELVPFNPEVKVFPLTGTPAVYKTSVMGPVTFVDERLNPVELPFEPEEYAVLRDGGAYALYSEPHGWVLMLADGTVPRRTNGEYITLRDMGEAHAYFIAAGKAVVTARPNDGHDGWTYGLYDLELRRESVTPQYETLRIALNQSWSQQTDVSYSPIFYGIKDGTGYLLGEKGRVLYDMGPAEAFSEWGGSYQLYLHERIFLRVPETEYGEHLYVWRDGDDWQDDGRGWLHYYILYGGGVDGNGRGLFIFDPDGREIHRADNCESLLFRHRLTFQTDSGYFSLQKGGIVREDGPPPPEEWYYIGGGVSYNAITGLYTIQNHPGMVFLETEERLSPSRNGYVLRFRQTGSGLQSEPYIIYGLDAAPLMEDFYGAVYEAPAPRNGIFVYLDPDTCVLLLSNGGTVPVPNAPRVELRYSGG